MNNKFSFVVPALNEEDYIKRCVDSINVQSVKPYEIIVVDNGSSDKTVQIAKKLGCRVVKENKKGISHARNKGAKVAKGNVLCFIDADSFITGEWLKEADKILSNEKIRAADGLIVFSHKNFFKKVLYNLWTIVAFSAVAISSIIFSRHIFTGGNMAIRKKTFEKLGGFEPYVGEQFLLSKKFWKLQDNKGKFSFKMLSNHSTRRFEKIGYLKTTFQWIKSGFTHISQEEYVYRDKSS